MSDSTYSPRITHGAAAENASEVAADAAQEAQESLLAQHGWVGDYRANWSRTCKCGRVFGTTNGFGLHTAAVRRAADKLWDATYEQEHTAAMERAGY